MIQKNEPKLIGAGAYGLPEAARLAGVQPQTASRWLSGRVLKPDLPQVGGRKAVSFLDLVELFVVGRLRSEGVSLQTIRRVYTRLQDKLGHDHPFASQRLLTDGKEIFWEVGDEFGDRRLEEIRSGQNAMPQILERFLKEIEYDSDVARRWRISPGVVLDPARSFGKPTVDEGPSTHVLAAAFEANGHDTSLVADLYGVSPESVRTAVEFERHYNNAA
ncbi:MAG: hypothetical protein EA423_05055 [Phycisphaerales bacterium]|nr:MAG: hypothetical protein EA423_05055 [Phycisphaerales bacterium]